ncbi:hypothetical protein RU10_20900 [Pseudomonas fluorescens]|uniref:Uncharacterized protein n=1 Tax=Pseudomonas fluorescens TaxID=294 RepID=A0AAE2DUV2_PSEFL|nr:hypothetical protein RU10_20900 [Pseudomonas fluorescens]
MFFMTEHRAGFTPHPSPLPEEREPICGLFRLEFDSVLHVGVPCTNTSVSSLYLWERVRVRAAV